MDNEIRPAIPAKLKRQILVEAGHRCAIPTCRATQVEIAHIIPWGKVHEHKYENLIALCPNCHTRFDRGEIDEKSIRIYKAQLQFLTDRYVRLELDILDELAQFPDTFYLPFLKFNSILIKRILEEKLVEFRIQKAGAYFRANGVQVNPDPLYITQKGRDFIANMRKGQATTYDNFGEENDEN